ncbi:MAG: 30S ribosomal protein S3 [Candidatus Dojkabacteria bacterium]|nr:30S ribosomal protein S3 [Candidatus Dojkabacteria bacterium]
MAKKVIPQIYRIGINEKHLSSWFATRAKFAKYLHDDLKIRKIVSEHAYIAGIDKILISRNDNNVTVDLYVGRPGLAIGKNGVGIEQMEKEIKSKVGVDAKVNVYEVKQPYLSANIVAQNIVDSLKKGVPVKVAMKQQLDRIEASGAKGARIMVKGLGPIKQARAEILEIKGGRLPLTTLRSKIDYAFKEVLVDRMYGVKVWIYKGEI